MNFIQSMIQDASQQYYSTGKSNLTDAEFDSLLEKEQNQNPNSTLLIVGHGYDIDEDSTYGEKVDHRYGVVGSLPKCKVYKEFISTFKNTNSYKIISSTKLDGLSIVCYFEQGKFVQAVTRGNGYQGIDVTDKIRYITKLDDIHDDSFTGGIRGEIVMSFDNFKKFHELHPESKNARNSTVGLINNKEITSDLDFIDIIFYTIIGSENHIFNSYSDILQYLKIHLVDQKIVKYVTLDLLSSELCGDAELTTVMENLKDKWYGDYPYDGIVNCSDEIINNENIIIYISNAFKFKSESTETIVTDIEWNLSKTGYLIPRIQFEPIQLSGATIQYCTGHNALNIKELNLGKGAKVQITRSNEVIPYLEDVLEYGQPCELPRACPTCGSSLILNGVHLQCPNTQCKNADIQDALIWMDNIVPVDGLGDTLKIRFLHELLGDDISIENMYKHGPIIHVYSKYVKKKLFNETFNRMFTESIRLDAAILALNIPRFGDITAAKLAKYPDEIKKVYIDSINPMEKLQYLQVLKSIGNANFASLSQNEFKMLRLNLIKDQIIWHIDNVSKDYRGEVCITGKLSVKRSVFEDELRKFGYIAINSVKKNTKYLITDNPNSGSSKNRNADKYNIPKLTEKEFRSKYMK